jgi:basic membrane protein A
VLAIGVDADQYDDMPGTVVTSMIKRVDVAVFETIRSVLDGSFTGGVHAFGLKEQGIDYVHDGPHAQQIPPAVKERVAELRQDVIGGTIQVPSQ